MMSGTIRTAGTSKQYAPDEVAVLDPKQLTDKLSPQGARSTRWFFTLWTAFAGFCFVFGILFSLGIIGLTIWGGLNGQLGGNPLTFYAIFVPFMIVYEFVAWLFYRFGRGVLRELARRDDPFDADGQPRPASTGTDRVE
jgi:hypothetical protein